MSKKETISVQGAEIAIISEKGNDYISLTDMANAKHGEARAADIRPLRKMFSIQDLYYTELQLD